MLCLLSILLGNFVLGSLIVFCLFYFVGLAVLVSAASGVPTLFSASPDLVQSRRISGDMLNCLEHNVNCLESSLVAVYK
ncbi:hypothetical protein C0J52_00246 [Blattella germanica]|nr:hypothetical protein C0J52_00246 [Blattella germanica]